MFSFQEEATYSRGVRKLFWIYSILRNDNTFAALFAIPFRRHVNVVTA
jgi:hypothetical protein